MGRVRRLGSAVVAASIFTACRASTRAAGESDVRGLEHDRDIVACHGGPAWEGRTADRPRAWDQALTISDGRYTLDVVPRRGEAPFRPIDTNGPQRGGRPIVAFPPHHVKNVEIVEGADQIPVVTDDFILAPNPGGCDPGRTCRVTFRARKLGEQAAKPEPSVLSRKFVR